MKKKKLSDSDMVLDYQGMINGWRADVKHLEPYSYQEMEQALWHPWNLNNYHVTLSFDQNMTLLLDWALGFHMERGGK